MEYSPSDLYKAIPSLRNKSMLNYASSNLDVSVDQNIEMERKRKQQEARQSKIGIGKLLGTVAGLAATIASAGSLAPAMAGLLGAGLTGGGAALGQAAFDPGKVNTGKWNVSEAEQFNSTMSRQKGANTLGAGLQGGMLGYNYFNNSGNTNADKFENFEWTPEFKQNITNILRPS